MEPIQIFLVAGSVLSAFLAILFFWLAFKSGIGKKSRKKHHTNNMSEAEYDVEHIFNNEFREELRNRGRLYFEKIINENAMFLQQDLRLTTSQLNDYMKAEIKAVLKEEFGKYEESISGAKDLAISSMKKTQAVIEDQREALKAQLASQVATEKALIMEQFEQDMAEIVNHYVLAAIGGEIDITDQLEYIIQYFEDNKQSLIEDLKHGV